MGRNALKPSANVQGQLGSHPSLYRGFAHRSHLEKMCGTTLQAASVHNPPVRCNQSTSIPQQTLHPAWVLQNSASAVTSTLPWAGLMQHLGHTEAGRVALWIKMCHANPPVRKSAITGIAPWFPTVTDKALPALSQELFLVCTELVRQGRELPFVVLVPLAPKSTRRGDSPSDLENFVPCPYPALILFAIKSILAICWIKQ